MKQINTPEAPAAIGPYSQAILAGGFLFVSGQIPLDPATGKIVGESISAQTTQVLDNIEAILRAEGLTVEHVVRTEIYLKDMNDFQEVNQLYAKRFHYPVKPARQTLQVAKLPLDVRIEISCIAQKPH